MRSLERFPQSELLPALAAGLLALALGWAPATSAQPAISMTVNSHLSFGQLVAGNSPGSITVSASGSRSASGGVTLGNGTTASPARFTVTGSPNTTYAITLPPSLTLVNGAESMTVDAFTSIPGGTGLLDGSGQQPLAIGGTLRVAAAQPAGAYSGSLLVTVAYN